MVDIKEEAKKDPHLLVTDGKLAFKSLFFKVNVWLLGGIILTWSQRWETDSSVYVKPIAENQK